MSLAGERFSLGAPLTGGDPGENASGPRPWGLRYAVTVPRTRLPEHRYDPARQVTVTPGGEPMPQLGTSKKTNPDGDPTNPPPWDEGGD
ncbi:hypothetical protein GCM10022254_63400 [Actinomadura meridiana]|uniref:ATP-grasp-modified RiPP n=1 Tax=Actinomadura meridiana TaxID=559626 RepID=A0ABP8CJZ5_9ACTN